MNANELMIGDYVINTEFDKNKVEKVEIIGGTRVWLSDENEYTPIVYVEPIDLTMDILLKNGFTKKFDYKCTLFYEDYYDLYAWEFNDEMWQICGHSREFAGIPDQQVDVCYVHELQHALRLFGIDKEIEL